MAAGRQSVVSRINGRVRVTPFSLGVSGFFSTNYNAVSTTVFGRSSFLQCPHLLSETGDCGIWPYRNHVCSTWFCKFNRGVEGEHFWKELRNLFSEVESVLRLSCAGQLLDDFSLELALAVDADSTNQRLAQELADIGDRSREDSMWGEWLTDQCGYYMECGRRVRDLSWDDVCSIGGVGIRTRQRLLVTAYGQLVSPTLAEHLQLGSFPSRWNTDGTVTLVGSNRSDPVVIDADVHAFLTHLDRGPIANAMAQAPQRVRHVLEEGLLQQLYDLRVLAQVEPAAFSAETSGGESVLAHTTAKPDSQLQPF